ncbi:hypothetical protein LGL08_18700 [Clostridium estertheticum]|uniref:tetratricopeptide repeat protein n=1 Tax=Clostridium estertheticum TaxID=238834 RepID=UPI001CF45D1E|nr:hypothetical protein [Clostridium estertheticum]MCB2308573.1 hypothetical protein [Clostridium estertheticum]MCB2344660.1 hypothetical protein [Clostridium estertheticum]MCB2351559.1 hypothetical protein [Clostridium estertheticum]WAG45525.1 hypothetical protein LL127_18690 [Clostridium estertheticum]
MNKRSILMVSLVMSLMFMGGCTVSSPVELIQPPKLLDSQLKKDDISSIAKQLLPDKSKLVAISKISTGNPVISVDVDNDKKDEIIAFFDLPESFEKGFVVIKEKNGKWSKVYEYKSEGSKIVNSEFLVVNGKKALLFGNLISTHAGVAYNLFTFDNDNIRKVNLGTWNKMEVLKTSLETDKKEFVFAGWKLYAPDNTYVIDLIRFDGEKVNYAKDLYKEYFKNVVKYYKGIIKENSLDVSQWYFLADSQVKANMYNDALISIQKGIDVNNDKNKTFDAFSDTEFYLLKAQSLNGLKKYDESKTVSEESAVKQINKLEKNTKAKDDKNDFNYMNDEKVLADIYLETAKSYYNLKQVDKGMQYYQKYLAIIKTLEKKGYFKDSIVNDNVEQLQKIK